MSCIRQRHDEDGTALLYTMVFLTLMVMATLTAVQFSSLEQRMSASYRTHQTAFVAAETAMLEAERCIKNQNSCNDINTFASDCSGGLCFSGSDRNSIISCRAGNARPWEIAALWTDAGKTIAAITLPSGTSARYVVEFLCYVPRTLFGVSPNPANPSDWSQLYRVTVLASVDNLNSQVMLQSTYKR
ncbi:PilX N-terminal domain-containing pilus assembly protein [Endozoicomonas sp. 8E]|uniref:pilus assembly PilX family protein n=1 Tax=Endozoicomonas sp. 8E TaxID=3035692 RepID=UPI002939499C|nr:PilX N-terminal domain-containing pilus assembly protein [Endozoicomonas sp. 8E]WOG26411.1 PilX N-terminal domain-containing pilus assembly protein [Endozoicomonas sp. 8E]